jgi:UDP-N-acetylmuramoyl-tripeptide--D-alanyl-D-alanine ligase
MLDALSKFVSPPGRMRLLVGVKKTLIIDDACNSSPVAMENALAALAELTCMGRKICVLGDMLELGKFSAEEHKRIGARVAKSADMLFTVGLRARGIAEGALVSGMSEKVITQYDDARTAGKELELALLEGDIVLVKGSQALRMERAVEEIMAHPEKKEELLVRQDPEWVNKA